MKNIITSFFMGGLGNQLFQAAHALSQGWKHNRPAVFIPRSHTPGQGRNTQNYIDNIFRNLKFVDNVDGTTVHEPSFEYGGVEPDENNTVFYGYFQSTKNWFGYENEIRNIFQPSEETIRYFFEKYPQLKQPNTLSLHVRRSEYLQLSNIHPTISLEYIQKGLEIIGEHSTVFIFSDDHDFVKENLRFDNCVFVNEPEDYLELWLIGLCKNHIMSNSTFSWWGTFLNKNIDKKIVAPSTWFGPDGPNPKDIYEHYWNIVEVEYNNGILNLKK